jgi:hypothetical protein
LASSAARQARQGLGTSQLPRGMTRHRGPGPLATQRAFLHSSQQGVRPPPCSQPASQAGQPGWPGQARPGQPGPAQAQAPAQAQRGCCCSRARARARGRRLQAAGRRGSHPGGPLVRRAGRRPACPCRPPGRRCPTPPPLRRGARARRRTLQRSAAAAALRAAGWGAGRWRAVSPAALPAPPAAGARSGAAVAAGPAACAAPASGCEGWRGRRRRRRTGLRPAGCRAAPPAASPWHRGRRCAALLCLQRGVGWGGGGVPGVGGGGRVLRQVDARLLHSGAPAPAPLAAGRCGHHLGDAARRAGWGG